MKGSAAIYSHSVTIIHLTNLSFVCVNQRNLREKWPFTHAKNE